MSQTPPLVRSATGDASVRAGRVVVLLLAGAASVSIAFAQALPRNPPLTIQSLAGRDLFEFHCATCHGRDGTGSGPVAAALTRPPPDLTRLAIEHLESIQEQE